MNKYRKDILEQTGVDVPISGGLGQSKDDPIIIEEKDPSKSAYWEHEVIGFIAMMRGQKYSFVGAKTFELNGRMLEQFKIEWEGDDENYYNFYFDISEMRINS